MHSNPSQTPGYPASHTLKHYKLILQREPPFPKGVFGYNEYGFEITEERPWHWTHARYGDWSEPFGWQSDYISYLVTLGMTRNLVNKCQNGYRPDLKPGRPLLLYATCTLAPDYAIENLERDTVDPEMVEELLKRNCDPN
jgi:hypothetical protein